MIKKYIIRPISALLVLLSPILVPLQVSAIGAPTTIPNPTRIDSLEELINIALGLIRPVFIITFVAMILYGAFVWMTAGDDDSKIQKARKIIIAAIIGLAIAVFAPIITNFVSGFIGLQGIETT